MYKLKNLFAKLNYRHFLYFFAMTAGWPSVLSFMGWLPPFKIGYMILAVLCFIYVMNNRSPLPAPINNIVIIQLVTFIMYSLIHFDGSYVTRSFYLIITASLLMIQARFERMEFIDINVGWLALQSLMGGIGFILVLVGLLHPISMFQEFDGHYAQFYGLFTTTVFWDGFLRVAGFFDEPGAFACWGIVAMLYNKLFLDNKKIEIVLAIGLISTLSMAYFIQVAIYFFLFYSHNRNKFLFYGLLFVGVLFIVSSINENFQDAIFGRFEMNEDGTIAGNSRVNSIPFCRDIWLSAPLFGVGAENLIQYSIKTEGDVSTNFFSFFATDGLIGQFVLWLPTLYLLVLGKRNKKYLFAAIVLFVGYIQRAYDPTQLLYPLCILSMCQEGYREQNLGLDNARSIFVSDNDKG